MIINITYYIKNEPNEINLNEDQDQILIDKKELKESEPDVLWQKFIKNIQNIIIFYPSFLFMRNYLKNFNNI